MAPIVPGRLNALIGKLAGEKKEGEKAGLLTINSCIKVRL
jgi:hypothetical protein